MRKIGCTSLRPAQLEIGGFKVVSAIGVRRISGQAIQGNVFPSVKRAAFQHSYC